jgi:hypothetical protein
MVPLDSVVKKWLPVAAVVLLIILCALVLLAPAESRLGNLVKLVYVHGALVWAGLATFTLAGALGLVALAVRHLARSAGCAQKWYRATRAAGVAALVIWIIYVISAILVTGLTWGQWIAWNEPRVQATALILGAALVLALVARLVGHPDFTAIVNVVMGILPWILVSRADAIRHPVDPIGGSNSSSIQGYFLLIQLAVLALAAILVAWLWARAEQQAAEGKDVPAS